MNTDVKIRPYKSNLDYSYAFGVYPTIELLKFQPDNVIKVLLRSNSDTNSGVKEIKKLCNEIGVEAVIADGGINKIAHKENTYAIGIFQKYNRPIDKKVNHIVLDGVRNMGNLGTISRTMLGFGLHNLAIIRPAADIFNPKAVRSAMGAMFQLKFDYFESLEEYQKYHTNHLYPVMLDGKHSISDATFEQPFSIVFGSEANGLPKKYRNVGTSIAIPQKGDIDSLNLSVAAGITLYEATK